MIKKAITQPDYIFECSWEVCNKVGGIYTVLSTKARTLQQRFTDTIIFIGPDRGKPDADFREDPALYADWAKAAASEGLSVRKGRWQIPGTLSAFLRKEKRSLLRNVGIVRCRFVKGLWRL